MANAKKRKRTKENESSTVTALKKIAAGTLSGTAIFFVLLFIFALITVKAQLSSSMQNILPFVSVGISCFVGAYLTGRMFKKNGLMYGMTTSLIENLLICIVLLIVNRELGVRTLIMLAVSLVSGIVGGVTAVNKKVKRK